MKPMSGQYYQRLLNTEKVEFILTVGVGYWRIYRGGLRCEYQGCDLRGDYAQTLTARV